jgi:16S rRNA (adenine(1408)-N(1))-methyltransferase
METIHGKQSAVVGAEAVRARLAAYRQILIDIGTGDGRYVQTMATQYPGQLAIGLDACRENLVTTSRKAPPNALFVVANALAMPEELEGCATHITINFPWGSLLTALLAGDVGLLHGLARIGQPGAIIDVRLNAGAVIEAGATFEASGPAVMRSLSAAGFRPRAPRQLDCAALRRLPTTWSKRLAIGRDPRALYLPAALPATGFPLNQAGLRRGELA